MLGSVHPERGVDLVPVVFALDGVRVVVPVDTVKPKRHTRLQRLANVAADARCALLVEHYSDAWDELWWVRVSGRAEESAPTPTHLDLLAARYPQYAEPGSVARVLVLTPEVTTGWVSRSRPR